MTDRNNPLKTRSDLGRNLFCLLEPLQKFSVPGGYHLGYAGARHSPKVAVMEGWSRCLWGIGPYISGIGDWPGTDELLVTLKRGVDPSDDAYWGDCFDKDQRLVEMASIAMCLLLAPRIFWETLNETEKQNLYRWLSQIEKRELPPTNWCFFRLLVCAAFRNLGLPVDEKAERESLNIIESCYREDGWYQDGKGGGFDFYNPMGFHFYSLILAEFTRRSGLSNRDIYQRYIDRAKIFGPRFAAWFHHDGSVVPYGRSLTYRFAAVSFFCACAFAGVEAIPWGQMKGIVLRHLRWWFSRPAFDSGGVLSVGYAYPNQVIADIYNAPGSSYWALKSYLVLALGDDHPFWQAEESPLPHEELCLSEKTGGFIVSRSGNDTQLLAGGSSIPEMNHSAQKYSKFAYSARFGFNVSLGNYGDGKIGSDSMLLLSEGDGYWRERREIIEKKIGENWIHSRWQPWPDVDIVTVLIRLGDWHIRIHRINSGRRLQTSEGGFSIPRFGNLSADKSRYAKQDTVKPLLETAADGEAFIAFPDYASRITALENSSLRKGAIAVPAPNLNIIHPSVVVPVLEGSLEPGKTVLVCAVIAGNSDYVRAEKIPPAESFSAFLNEPF